MFKKTTTVIFVKVLKLISVPIKSHQNLRNGAAFRIKMELDGKDSEEKKEISISYFSYSPSGGLGEVICGFSKWKHIINSTLGNGGKVLAFSI